MSECVRFFRDGLTPLNNGEERRLYAYEGHSASGAGGRVQRKLAQRLGGARAYGMSQLPWPGP